MGLMADGNSFFERQHSASQARAEERHDAYGPQVIESLVDKLFDGGKVCGMTIHDFCESALTFEDIGAVLLAHGDERITRLGSLRDKVISNIREWCAGPGADEVDELVRSWEEDDRADAMEARHAVSEAI